MQHRNKQTRARALKGSLRMAIVSGCLLLITACEAPVQRPEAESAAPDIQRADQPRQSAASRAERSQAAMEKPHNIESTLFLDNMTASVSLRATVSAQPATSGSDPSLLREGYKLQFRSINLQAVSIAKVVINSGGNTISLEPGSVVVPAGKGYTLSLSVEDSRKILPEENASLVFQYQGRPVSVLLREHQLIDLFETAQR